MYCMTCMTAGFATGDITDHLPNFFIVNKISNVTVVILYIIREITPNLIKIPFKPSICV
jgi:hypothetical protein